MSDDSPNHNINPSGLPPAVTDPSQSSSSTEPHPPDNTDRPDQEKPPLPQASVPTKQIQQNLQDSQASQSHPLPPPHLPPSEPDKNHHPSILSLITFLIAFIALALSFFTLLEVQSLKSTPAPTDQADQGSLIPPPAPSPSPNTTTQTLNLENLGLSIILPPGWQIVDQPTSPTGDQADSPAGFSAQKDGHQITLTGTTEASPTLACAYPDSDATNDDTENFVDYINLELDEAAFRRNITPLVSSTASHTHRLCRLDPQTNTYIATNLFDFGLDQITYTTPDLPDSKLLEELDSITASISPTAPASSPD